MASSVKIPSMVGPKEKKGRETVFCPVIYRLPEETRHRNRI